MEYKIRVPHPIETGALPSVDEVLARPQRYFEEQRANEVAKLEAEAAELETQAAAIRTRITEGDLASNRLDPIRLNEENDNSYDQKRLDGVKAALGALG